MEFEGAILNVIHIATRKAQPIIAAVRLGIGNIFSPISPSTLNPSIVFGCPITGLMASSDQTSARLYATLNYAHRTAGQNWTVLDMIIDEM